MNTSRTIQKRLFPVLVFIIVGILFGVLLVITVREELSLKSFLSGTFWGLVISFLILTANIILRPLNKLRFGLVVLLKGVIYSIIAWIVTLIRLKLNNELHPIYVSQDFMFEIVIFSTFILSFLLSFLTMIHHMLGTNTLVSFLTGKYYRPIEEERIFMFVDLESSTTIAEEIGHLKFHNLLNNIIYGVTDIILKSEGETYKYVGDEIIITWPVESGIKNNNCLRAYYGIFNYLEQNKQYYLQEYGIKPHVRAGAHIGLVTTGELGDYKREIAYLGDTVNTASRIQSECKTLNKDLIISSRLLDRLNLKNDYRVESLGVFKLTGKSKAVELIDISLP